MSALLERLWFVPERPTRLAAIRIFVGIFALVYVLATWDVLVDTAGSDPRLFAPVGIVKLLDKPLDPDIFGYLLKAVVALNVLFVLGARHRFTGPLFALSLLGVLTYRASWSTIEHDAHLLCLHVLVLGFTPAANALSFDSWTRSRLGSKFPEFGAWKFVTNEEDWRFGWPVRLLCAATVLVYLIPGLAKVLGPVGAAWDHGSVLRGLILYDGIQAEMLGDGASAVASMITASIYPALLTALGVAVLIIELGAPLVLLKARAARVWCGLIWVLHVALLVVMGTAFPYQLSLVAFVPFFPVEKLFPNLGRPGRNKKRIVVGPVPDELKAGSMRDFDIPADWVEK
jgi:hypothetical protein